MPLSDRQREIVRVLEAEAYCPVANPYMAPWEHAAYRSIKRIHDVTPLEESIIHAVCRAFLEVSDAAL